MPPEVARSALDAARDAMIIIDDAGIICFANRQASAMFGYAREEIVAHSVEQLLPQRFRQRHIEHRRGYWNNVGVRPMGVDFELLARRQDDTKIPVEISLSLVQEGSPTLVAAAIRDVSERKRMEAELIIARQGAEHANQAKSRFLATASHDLRQPPQSLALLNETLPRITTDQDAAAAVAQQELVSSAMSRLLNAELDMRKLESGSIKPETIDFTVGALFERMHREFVDIAASRGLQLRVRAGSHAVHSDPSLVEQILRNLLSNAIKYTHEGWVALRSTCAGSSVRVEVLDTGIGIPADQLSCMYDELYLVRVPANRSREGYRLGLSIVQRLVTLLGFKLEVQSQLGKGPRFTLELPAATQQALSTAAPQAGVARPPPVPLGKPRVLLVEDDPAVRDATRLLLRGEGYEVKVAASLAEALGVAKGEGTIDVA
jgi:two-component system, sensor histidine kinase